MTTVATPVRVRTVWPMLWGVALLAGAVAAGVGGLSLVDALAKAGI